MEISVICPTHTWKITWHFPSQMEIAAATYYPGFARHIFLRAYRYNMHFKPKTLLIEAGAQTNTVEEMRNAMEILAELLHQVLS